MPRLQISHLLKKVYVTKSAECYRFLMKESTKVIEAYFGINQREMTLEEIGDKYGLTRERVRQIKEKGLYASSDSKQIVEF